MDIREALRVQLLNAAFMSWFRNPLSAPDRIKRRFWREGKDGVRCRCALCGKTRATQCLLACPRPLVFYGLDAPAAKTYAGQYQNENK